MIEFALAVFFLLITPGPGVLTVAGVGAGYGMRAGVGYMLGIIAGAQCVLLLVASGVWAAAASVPYLREVLLFGSTGYLFYLALRIAVAGSNVAFIEAKKAPKFHNGVLLAVVNPKGYAVGTILFSGFHFLPAQPFLEIASKFAIQLAVALPVHVVWLYAGVTPKSLDLSPGVTRAINIGMALALVAVVGLALFAEFQPSA